MQVMHTDTHTVLPTVPAILEVSGKECVANHANSLAVFDVYGTVCVCVRVCFDICVNLAASPEKPAIHTGHRT